MVTTALYLELVYVLIILQLNASLTTLKKKVMILRSKTFLKKLSLELITTSTFIITNIFKLAKRALPLLK